MLKSMGRSVAAAIVGVMLFAACSTAAPAGGSTAPSAAGSAAAGPITVGYLPKDIVNQYFAAAKTGMDKAAAETPGSKIIQVGPNEPKADLQVPFIKDLTTQKVNAIIISADGKDEVAPDLMHRVHQLPQVQLDAARLA